jgi:tRNA 2-thiouridine synthesizing protein E
MLNENNLTEDHWTVINTVRNFYLEFHLHPTVRVLIKKLSVQWGKEKANSIYLHQLFPEHPITTASYFAKIPKPLKCI